MSDTSTSCSAVTTPYFHSSLPPYGPLLSTTLSAVFVSLLLHNYPVLSREVLVSIACISHSFILLSTTSISSCISYSLMYQLFHRYKNRIKYYLYRRFRLSIICNWTWVSEDTSTQATSEYIKCKQWTCRKIKTSVFFLQQPLGALMYLYFIVWILIGILNWLCLVRTVQFMTLLVENNSRSIHV